MLAVMKLLKVPFLRKSGLIQSVPAYSLYYMNDH